MSTCHKDKDSPKSLRDPLVNEERRWGLREPHVAQLTAFVEKLRRRTGYGDLIPYFDPFDGGTRALCLFLFEAPGPKAVESGFISRNNPDETARNFFILNEEVRLARSLTVSWNIVPWYVGSGSRITPATTEDVIRGVSHLVQLIRMLPHLRAVVLAGRKAERAKGFLEKNFPPIRLFTMPHPSPQFVHRNRSNRRKIVKVLRQITNYLT